ncbi:ground-like domain protein [Ancylostoma duodenale]|uniref:Ground-like domain protein n=1 Tax=Ancylostoma duodenale TaxID=51022 RepID=A0A0C2H6W2_9BILA|nr:ground-like domain protein [Ancylostoma duodenale]
MPPYGGGYYGGGGYGGPPVYPVRGPYRHRRRRETLVRAAHDEQCTIETIGEIIEQAMTSSVMQSRERIRRSLLTHYGRENVVLCSPHRIVFTVTDGAEYCERIREGISCYAFVF